MIYFDNAATTFIDKRVVQKMMDVLSNIYGNPSGKYYAQAINANKLISEARDTIANFFNVNSDEIIFNSGASEGNNHIIKGIAFENPGCHIITTNAEHHSSIQACLDLEEMGYDISFLKVNSQGVINLDELKNTITSKTKLLSIIWANNEIGSLNDIVNIAKICKENNVLLHVDATQAIGKIKIDLNNIPIDFLTFSGHKIYGPKGVGILFMRRDEYGLFPYVKPLISGSQEDDQRGGTHCTHNIVGIGEAIKILQESQNDYVKHLWNIETYLVNQLKDINIIFNGYNRENKVPGIINIQIPNINNEIFLKENKDRFALSTGSACSLEKPSHVLEAIGLDKNKIRNSIRISLGKENSLEEIDLFVQSLKEIL